MSSLHGPRCFALGAVVFLTMTVLAPSSSRAEIDEPGLLVPLDEPGAPLRRVNETGPSKTGASQRGPSEKGASSTTHHPAFRVALAFGLSSLVVDPDINQGIGGGLYVAYGLQTWIGVEATVFVSHNTYNGRLGEANAAFSGGNISLGPIFQLTRPGARFSMTLDLGVGFYHVAPTIQAGIWTLGVSGGLTLGIQLTRWLGIGIKPRYHLHNLATVSGPDLMDLKSLRGVGVIDRLEVPVYVALSF